MADKVTEETVLGIGVEYVRVAGDKAGDTKTTYFKLPSPKGALSEALIRQVTEPLLTVQGENTTPFWTDPDTGEAMSDAKILTAYTEWKREIEYDLEVPE